MPNYDDISVSPGAPSVVPRFIQSSETKAWTDVFELGEQYVRCLDPLFKYGMFCDYLKALDASKSLINPVVIRKRIFLYDSLLSYPYVSKMDEASHKSSKYFDEVS